jgi:RIO kinase 2
VHHDRRKYDGYRLTYMGYDFLAIKAMLNRGSLCGLGRQIGIGKESDVFLAINEDGVQMALKIHRLGRTSFTNVRNLRDYVGNRKGGSWLYLSRLAAAKEYAFMNVLDSNDFPVPKPIDHSRHCVLMSLVTGYPLTQVGKLAHPEMVYNDCTGILLRLARCGLIHGDFNEFNFIIDDNEKVTMIDFPQMVSTSHFNAQMYFDRDAAGIHTFFAKKLGYSQAELISWRDIGVRESNLDEDVEASGFSKEQRSEMEKLIKEQNHAKDEEGAEGAETNPNNAADSEVDRKLSPGEDYSGEILESVASRDALAEEGQETSFLDLAVKSAPTPTKRTVDPKIKERVRANIARKKKHGGGGKRGGTRNKVKNRERRKLTTNIKESRS